MSSTIAPLPCQGSHRPDRAEVEEAIRVLIRWAGADPEMQELRETPHHVASYFENIFAYDRQSAITYLREGASHVHLKATGMVALTHIPFRALCPHHLVPFWGNVSIGYIPRENYAGVGHLANVVTAVSSGVHLQEELTQEIASVLEEALLPEGVIVFSEARHLCIDKKYDAANTMAFQAVATLGAYQENTTLREEFLHSISPSATSHREDVSPRVP